MVQTGEDAYEANLKLQVASVGGTFKGSIALSDKIEPETCRITVQGSGTIGHGTGNARFELQTVSDTETKLLYQGSGEAGGFGKASCRDREWQYGLLKLVDVALK